MLEPDVPKRGVNWGELALTTAAAALTTIEHRRLDTGARWAYKVALAGLSGAYALLPNDDVIGDVEAFQATPTEKASIAAAVAGLTLGTAEPLMALDGKMVDWIEARGVPRPRLWLAGMCALAGVATAIVSARRPPILIETEEPQPAELRPEVRSVVTEMLAKTDGWGAHELRAQLARAQGIDSLDAYGSVDFVVADDAPRTEVKDYLFPVTGYGDVDGVPYEVSLFIAGGVLEMLIVQPLLDDVDTYRLPQNLEYEVGRGS